MTLNKSIGYYNLIFAGVFIGISILIGVIGALLSSGMAGMTVVTPFIAAMIAGSRFLKVEDRRPTDLERRRLTNGNFLTYVGISLVLVGLAALGGAFGEGAPSVDRSTVWLIVGALLVFVFLIVYFMIRWAYRGLLDKQADKLNLNNSTFD